MLVELVVENFYSFRDENAFSMVASTIEEHPDTVTDQGELSLNKVSTIYGANASGKSNLLRAVHLMKEGLFVAEKNAQKWLDKIQPFHLDVQTEKQDSLIEMSFLLEGTMYRYGFYANTTKIVEEYLYADDEVCFTREGLEMEGPWQLPEGESVQAQRLVLADMVQNHAAMWRWFCNMRVIFNARSLEFTISKAKLHLKKYKHNLMTLIQAADPSIHDVEIKDDEFYVIKLKKQADGSWEPIREGFLFQDVESAGTVKLLSLAGPIIEALEQGSLLLIDEMDQSFHTFITRYVLELFRGEFNRYGAQLVFSTHDVSNLRSELFRRDQIWFVEKKREGNSDLVSLVEYRFDERDRKNSFNFHQHYLNGKYGAVPFVPPADWWVNNGET